MTKVDQTCDCNEMHYDMKWGLRGENQGITPPPYELELQFEAQANERIHSLIEACFEFFDPYVSDAIWTDFQNWVTTSAQTLHNKCNRILVNSFHKTLSQVVPSVEFSLKPKFLPAPEP